jgi:hypothetical protein
MMLCLCREEEEEALLMRKVEDYNNYTSAPHPPPPPPSPSLWRQDKQGRMATVDLTNTCLNDVSS